MRAVPGAGDRAGAILPAARSAVINPANIKRVARELPPGYEVGSDVPEGAPPRALWHLGPVRPPRRRDARRLPIRAMGATSSPRGCPVRAPAASSMRWWFRCRRAGDRGRQRGR
ncbi:hypothetical protein I551_7610 [Mycobacterium ulcerans str. Harvey]|uniref:Uncharacterized protein n=1 Tax=Mycobacterium ulcerans str. Harvey TaxID=1299332 RepID=A0ABP3A5K9_MYCUL|nr:hypothetical protein I551_7610 [Mycobacterium ulcerans str. Harvey]